MKTNILESVIDGCIAGDKDLLLRKIEDGIYPTSFCRLLKCSYKFYLYDILKVREEQSIEEYDNRVQGIIIHDVLEKLLAPWLRKPLAEDLLKKLKGDITSTILDRINTHLDDSFSKGLKFVESMRVNKIVSRIIDQLHPGIEIISIEETYSYKTNLSVENKLDHSLQLAGKLDRVEKSIENKLTITDYKLSVLGDYDGSISAQKILKDPNMLSQLFDSLIPNKYNGAKDKAIQLSFYALLFYRQTGLIADDVQLKSLSRDKDVSLDYGIHAPVDYLLAFETFVFSIISRITHEDYIFERTTEISNCENCEYRIICGRI